MVGKIGRPRTGDQKHWISERDQKLIYYREERGESYGQLSRRFGITRQRVERIINTYRKE
jgi:Mor family transcriptional regulator